MTTLAVLTTGVLLLSVGHKSGALLEIHKVSFIVWLAMFAIHFLAYVPRVGRSIRTDWSSARRQRVPGAGLRAMMVTASLGGGVAVAVALVSSMESSASLISTGTAYETGPPPDAIRALAQPAP